MWVVFKIQSWDYERSCQIFETASEAENALQKSWEDALNDALATPAEFLPADIDMSNTYHDPDYAELSFCNRDRIEWFLTIAEGI